MHVTLRHRGIPLGLPAIIFGFFGGLCEGLEPSLSTFADARETIAFSRFPKRAMNRGNFIAYIQAIDRLMCTLQRKMQLSHLQHNRDVLNQHCLSGILS